MAINKEMGGSTTKSTDREEIPGLQYLGIPGFTTLNGAVIDISLSYQTFGKPLHSAPVVLVNHALTGNSLVAGPDGWWASLVGPDKCIDTNRYTVLCFNIPGNGYDGFLIERYKEFVAADIARIFLMGLESLQVQKVFALIGGSLGGGIAWEMAALRPGFFTHLIPVASDWKSTDWLIANCQIQEQFLVNSRQPVHDARMHAMLCYRTPESFKQRFQRSTDQLLQRFNVESWLLHHGKKLQERFQLAAYKLTNQLLKTIDITRNGDAAFEALQQSATNIHIIGVDSDLFFTATENKETYKQLAQANNNVTYGEIQSVHGHDAFLIEFEQMEQLLRPIFREAEKEGRLKVLKFGGKSLANGEGVERVLQIIKKQTAAGDRLVVVLSARQKATDQLIELLNTAASGEDFSEGYQAFVNYQQYTYSEIDLRESFEALFSLLQGIRLVGDYSPKTKDQVLAFGELISARVLTELLLKEGLQAIRVDARELIKTDTRFGDAQVDYPLSEENVIRFYHSLKPGDIPVITGFIASNQKNETTTLGRNGSNYTASLLANFLNADELQNYTHVDGIFTADPGLVPEAQKISRLSYSEANELANFGANILHAKTIIPLLEKNIPLRILNTFKEDSEGTLISAEPSKEGIRSLSVIENEALINLEGRGLLGRVGIDARIFRALGQSDISVGIISQGSSERGIGLVVKAEQAGQAKTALEREFEDDLKRQDINRIQIVSDVSVISIVGQDLSSFHKPYTALIRNQIVPLLFNNTVTGKNVSLVVKKADMLKAVNVIHGQIFGISQKINLALFGIGNVGATLIEQLLDSAENIESRKSIRFNIFAIANSSRLLLDHKGIGKDWQKRLQDLEPGYSLQQLFDYARKHHLENLIAVDNTASTAFVGHYPELIRNSFDLVSSNKIANTLGFEAYRELRKLLKDNQKNYLYETNVGAGLPLIDTIKLLHLSGENITGIRGVFSGSLSYIFNTFSAENLSFSEVLQQAREKGYTEPDPREDLSGNDVGRKLLILARELDLKNEFEDIQIENLIPEDLRTHSEKDLGELSAPLDGHYRSKKAALPPGFVLRYVGELSGDLQQDKGVLQVKLVAVPKESTLGQVQGADSLIEIFTESYGDKPLVIQGAGAGAAVTARGVFGDILRIAEKGYAD